MYVSSSGVGGSSSHVSRDTFHIEGAGTHLLTRGNPSLRHTDVPDMHGQVDYPVPSQSVDQNEHLLDH